MQDIWRSRTDIYSTCRRLCTAIVCSGGFFTAGNLLHRHEREGQNEIHDKRKTRMGAALCSQEEEERPGAQAIHQDKMSSYVPQGRN